MKILNVATDPIKIEMNSQNASLNLHTIAPQIKLETEAARLEIRQPKGDLQIDSTAFRSSYGIKGLQAFVQDKSQEAKSIGLERIAEIVEEGNRMGQIGSGENAIVEIAIDSSDSSAGELTWAPLAKPEIHYRANHPQIKYVDGKFDLKLERGHVQSDFQPGKVNISVAQYPSLKKWTSEKKVDLML